MLAFTHALKYIVQLYFLCYLQEMTPYILAHLVTISLILQELKSHNSHYLTFIIIYHLICQAMEKTHI